MVLLTRLLALQPQRFRRSTRMLANASLEGAEPSNLQGPECLLSEVRGNDVHDVGISAAALPPLYSEAGGVHQGVFGVECPSNGLAGCVA